MFLTAFLIALSFLPKPPARQTIEVRERVIGGLSDSPRLYSLALGDPRLVQIRRQILNYGHSKPAAALGMARWQAETAAIYAQRTNELAVDPTTIDRPTLGSITPVIPVSFTNQAKTIDLVGYWNQVDEQARGHLLKLETVWRQQQATIGPPPVRLGNVTQPLLSGTNLGYAALIAFLAMLLMAVWIRVQPPRRLVGASAEDMQAISTKREQSQGKSSSQSENQLPVILPAAWIRLRQPIGVHLRKIVYVGLFATAVGCWTI
ncbi:hypothetical protein K227x_39780 [Rubripirellula lacrimiformis]|uniref:Uncharacterized protein n=1 Tax=Rubripirellula lacrimiformis TaxID=1930273 RepID=A0A517NEL8_9BACT|nr:hypothetical protein K227x_39780 [Rubripirellula lacrimiformis]